MEPIKGNSLSKSCGEILSSNCIVWSGPAVSGVCGPNATITQVIQKALDCCVSTPVIPSSPCAVQGWVDFSAGITVSTTDILGASVNILGFQNFQEVQGFTPIVNSNPMYRFGNDGNLQLRGVVNVEYGVSIDIGYAFLDMATISTSCFPSTFTEAQVVLTEVEFQSANKVGQFLKAYAILYPNGKLRLLMDHYFNAIPYGYVWSISLGGVTFNL